MTQPKEWKGVLYIYIQTTFLISLLSFHHVFSIELNWTIMHTKKVQILSPETWSNLTHSIIQPSQHSWVSAVVFYSCKEEGGRISSNTNSSSSKSMDNFLTQIHASALPLVNSSYNNGISKTGLITKSLNPTHHFHLHVCSIPSLFRICVQVVFLNLTESKVCMYLRYPFLIWLGCVP